MLKKASMSFSSISYSQDITHPFFSALYNSLICGIFVGDSLFLRQVAVVHPVMEPEHLAEKRHTFSGHGLPSIGVTSKYSTQESRDHLSSNVTEIDRVRYRKCYQIES